MGQTYDGSAYFLCMFTQSGPTNQSAQGCCNREL